MEGRRVRRFGRAHSQTVLPLRVRHLSNTVSCWYCDFKSAALNEPLFRFGRRHSRFLRVWFSVGIGFSITTLLGVTMVFSTADVGYICISTVISVFIHELGHALSAASEGIQIEYIAVFLAVLFPGALVAFNHEVLQALPRVTALRIYCAGIWHNAAFCAVCAMALFLLPLVLYPIYTHGESPMVLDISSTSPLAGCISPGDLIVSLDGVRIHNADEWMEMAALLHKQTLQKSEDYNNLKDVADGRKGYCVLSSLIEESKHVQLIDDQVTCPVYFLDGESILESALPFFGLMSSRSRETLLKSCLLGGTCISILVFLRCFVLSIFKA